MKNHWVYFYRGMVKVKVSGRGTERFINILTRNSFLVWNLKREGTETLTFYIQLSDVHNLRRAARNSDCEVNFLHRKGLPFLWKRLLKNSGFIVGPILFIALVFMLSNMVWGIEIKGANPDTEYKIRKELDKMGVQTGKIQFFLDDEESIQRTLTDNIQSLTWVGVELQGTKYHMQVVEKKQPKEPKYVSNQHLVAKKKAVIVNMFVEKGQPMVNVHDHVEKGQLLVSGLIGKEEQWREVAAQGIIFGETWYKSSVELPLKTNFSVYNGNEQRKYYLNINGFKLPIWGFKKNEFEQFEVEENEKKVHFLKWTLPISLNSATIREKEDVTRSYTVKEAVSVAKEMAKNDIKSRLDDEAKIKGIKILHQSEENGKVKLILHFQVIENIAIGQPIIKETEE